MNSSNCCSFFILFNEQKKNHLVIQTHHSTLELLFLIYLFYTVFPCVINRCLHWPALSGIAFPGLAENRARGGKEGFWFNQGNIFEQVNYFLGLFYENIAILNSFCQ